MRTSVIAPFIFACRCRICSPANRSSPRKIWGVEMDMLSIFESLRRCGMWFFNLDLDSSIEMANI